jgi:hypothetical protein
MGWRVRRANDAGGCIGRDAILTDRCCTSRHPGGARRRHAKPVKVERVGEAGVPAIRVFFA